MERNIKEFNIMNKLIMTIGVFAILFSGSFAYAGNNYYQKYLQYKAKYEKVLKENKKLKKEISNMGNDYESCYMELVQCQRTINGENPWLDAINSK